MIDGVISLRFDGEEQLLSPGGEAIVPAGFHHTMCAVSGEARIVMGYPARALAARVSRVRPAAPSPSRTSRSSGQPMRVAQAQVV